MADKLVVFRRRYPVERTKHRRHIEHQIAVRAIIKIDDTDTIFVYNDIATVKIGMNERALR